MVALVGGSPRTFQYLNIHRINISVMAFTIMSQRFLWSHRQSVTYQLYQTLPLSLYHPCSRGRSVVGRTFGSTMAFKDASASADSASLPFEYVPVEEVERLEKYQPGGYHPIIIGDVLQSRYRVAHKLGYGTFSTTWLCQDKQSGKYVVVKVGTAESSAREVEVLDYLNQPSLLDHPGRAMIPSVQDRFVLHGPNGNHFCYATALARCSISGAKDGSYRRIFQASTARSLIAQLALAVDYIHSKGVVHGGKTFIS